MGSSHVRDDRAISPVGGVAALIVIIVTLSVVCAGLFLNCVNPDEPAPNVAFTFDFEETEVVARHHGGAVLNGTHLLFNGVYESNAYGDERLSSRDETVAMVAGDADESNAVYRHPDTGSSVLPKPAIPSEIAAIAAATMAGVIQGDGALIAR